MDGDDSLLEPKVLLNIRPKWTMLYGLAEIFPFGNISIIVLSSRYCGYWFVVFDPLGSLGFCDRGFIFLFWSSIHRHVYGSVIVTIHDNNYPNSDMSRPEYGGSGNFNILCKDRVAVQARPILGFC